MWVGPCKSTVGLDLSPSVLGIAMACDCPPSLALLQPLPEALDSACSQDSSVGQYSLATFVLMDKGLDVLLVGLVSLVALVAMDDGGEFMPTGLPQTQKSPCRFGFVSGFGCEG